MKPFLITFFFLFFSVCYSAQNKVYTFYIELNHHSAAPEFRIEKNELKYAGTNLNEKLFFDKYTLLDFNQAFPSSRVPRILNFFIVRTHNQNLMLEMMTTFPQKYIFGEDITDINIELASNVYPNDYGSESPVTNNGINANLGNLDYVNAPKTWGYTMGDVEIIVGVSDAKIDTTDIDFRYKTNFLQSYINSGLPAIPYNYNVLNSTHGTAVASIAAAQGNNSHGVVGVCSDCIILMAPYNYNTYNSLYELEENGAKVINMSWSGGYSSVNELVINELHERGIVLVAAAGNENPGVSTIYKYPASYDHVISVSGVNHKNTWGEEVVIVPDWGEVSRFVEDMISPSIVINYMGNGPYAFYATLNINDKVDICAPAYNYFRFAIWVGQGTIEYNNGGATSAATPHVSGTVGLMFSVNKCLLPDEVEDILQLTSKNIEPMVGNEPWAGKIGSGKLETGDAVEFVHEMKQPTGNALIDGHDFYRFNFLLENINNKTYYIKSKIQG